VVAGTGAQNPTVDKALNLKTILDLSIPKNVHVDVEELEGVTLTTIICHN
jgi:glutamyl-tRNA reductase